MAPLYESEQSAACNAGPSVNADGKGSSHGLYHSGPNASASGGSFFVITALEYSAIYFYLQVKVQIISSSHTKVLGLCA